MHEWDFYAQLSDLTGCGLWLDINNVYVSCQNFGYDAFDYLNPINGEYVDEIHLTGHAINIYEKGDIYIDDYGSKVSEQVWGLYQKTIQKFDQKPTLIEWDNNITTLSVLLNEAQKAQKILNT